ncbi:MAG: hypothetical protein LW834_07010 [Cyanobium sp. 49614_E6]|jgi:hypothetical protein|nr:hypothetical protein [Cyanobium sp. 49614_E6]
MDQRIVYHLEDGSLAVLIPSLDCGLTIEEIAAKDVPDGVSHQVVKAEAIPTDRLFRNAWALRAKKVVVDVEQAKEIAHGMRRQQRDEQLAPHDAVMAKRIPGVDLEAVEAERQAIRERNAVTQRAIDAAGTVEQLKALVEPTAEG